MILVSLRSFSLFAAAASVAVAMTTMAAVASHGARQADDLAAGPAAAMTVRHAAAIKSLKFGPDGWCTTGMLSDPPRLAANIEVGATACK